MSEPLSVQNGIKVSMDYALTVNGELVDKSQPDQPLQFVQGSGQIIRGLENELLDMMVGETKEVDVEPAQGYGIVNPNYIVTAPRTRFPPYVSFEVGGVLQIPGPNGQSVPALVLELTPDTVKLDLNHPLAGKRLHFKVTIAALSF
jgi:FKBP-type peptidyl-prolyl cis-trans isomerase SlyD